MAERSQFWDTTGTGDGADTYSAVQLREMFRALHTTDRYSAEGVLAGYGGELAVTGATSPLSVADGCAVVNGIYYQNTASVSVSVPTPSSGTTGHRVVLQALWSTQTVRVALISNADGNSSAPALTQTDNSRWEISLATLTIDTSGAIIVTDARDYCHYATQLVYRRRGGSSTSWNSGGSTNYTPGGVKVQMGMTTLTWSSNDQSNTKTVTFPSAFGQKPIVRAQLYNAGDSTRRKLLVTIESISATSVTLRGQRTDGSSSLSTTADVAWLAKGVD